MSLRTFYAALAVGLVSRAAAGATEFVTRSGTEFVLATSRTPVRFVGTNNYYLIYADQFMVDDVLETAARHNFSVVRSWVFLDTGFQNGSASIGGTPNGLYFQYFDPAVNGPAYNDSNLVHVDYVVAKAASLGLRLVLGFTNNWVNFGGMDQYLKWKELATPGGPALFHDDFYTDETVRGWYKAWVAHILHRVNTLTGVAYKDDPTIFAWELANEPRCQGSGAYPSTNNCTSGVGSNPVAWKLGAWVAEMSAFVKSQDPNHLVAVGDEGWLCQGPAVCRPGDWTCDGAYGVDNTAFAATPTVDFLSMHLYPSAWGQTDAWGQAWILNHTQTAHNLLGKPMLLGEFGFTDQQSAVYQQWLAASHDAGLNGALFWMLSGQQDTGGSANGWYPNYDSFGVYCRDNTSLPAPPWKDPATCTVLTTAANAWETPSE